MYRRAMGQETEFGHIMRRNGKLMDPSVINEFMKKFLSMQEWRRNGSRIYVDSGFHLEYATPECDSIEQIVASVLAGDQVIRRLVNQAAWYQFKKKGDIYESRFFRNNVCHFGEKQAEESFGCHENYQVDTIINPGLFIAPLLPYLATRQLILGAGRLIRTLDPNIYNFELSQRGSFLNSDSETTTMGGNKPLINTRDESHADGSKRLHLISGDNNILPQQTGLKFACMDILLAMLEAGITFNLETSRSYVVNQIVAMEPGKSFGTSHGKMTALNVQEYYLELAGKFLDTDSVYEPKRPWLNRWAEHIERLRGSLEPDEHFGKICWATKQVILRDYKTRHPTAKIDKMQELELLMHQVVGPGSLLDMLIARYGEFNAALVADFVSNAPPTTRAHVRDMAWRSGGKPFGWQSVKLPNRDQNNLYDPLDPTIPWL